MGSVMERWTVIVLVVVCQFVHKVYLTEDTYNGRSLVSLFPNTDPQLDFLQSLFNGIYDYEVDFWQAPVSTNNPVVALLDPSTRNRFLDQVKEQGIDYNETFPDFQKAIREEKKKIQGGRKRIFKDDSTFQLAQYNSWNEIEEYLRKSADSTRHVSQLQSIGKSHEGRDLLVLKLGTNSDKKKPAIWVDAGIHAREWISPATVLYMIDMLSNSNDSTNSSSVLQKYLDEIDWYFLPVMNPDGYAHTYVKDRMWRKNRSPEACAGRRCCQGVDLNRNFATAWGTAGASKNPCSNTYMGKTPFSEPESKAVRDFVMKHADTLKGFFTLHSFGQLWLYPYGYKRRTYPEDVEEVRQLSIEAVDAIKAVHGSKFKIGTAANILYSASGASEDWAKAEPKIKYSLCAELRPAGFGNGFILNPRHIIPSGEEIWAGIKVFADKIIEKYGSGSTSSPIENRLTIIHENRTSSSGSEEYENGTRLSTP